MAGSQGKLVRFLDEKAFDPPRKRVQPGRATDALMYMQLARDLK